MPHDLVTEKQTVLEKDQPGGHDRLMLQKYEAPADEDGGVAVDLLKEYDDWAAREVMNTLEQHYPGHLWRVIHDSKQGVCLISIPILMGVNKFMAVNLKTHTMDSARAVASGGEILERYGLARGRIHLPSFLDAREKHSILVNPHRKVPT